MSSLVNQDNVQGKQHTREPGADGQDNVDPEGRRQSLFLQVDGQGRQEDGKQNSNDLFRVHGLMMWIDGAKFCGRRVDVYYKCSASTDEGILHKNNNRTLMAYKTKFGG